MNILKALSDFTALSLFEASRNFFTELGVHCTEQSALPLNFLSIYEKSVKKLGLAVPQALAEVFAKIETTHVIGAVTEESLAGNTAETSLEAIEAEPHYKGMLLMAVKVKDGVTLTRTEMTQITRGANRIATHNPVTVLILQSNLLSIATCERTQFVQTWRPGEKLGKVSILKDINCKEPHRGHIDILLSMDVSACKTYDELYAQWKDVFSAKLLTKQFYREIQNWYFWALKKDQHVSYPNALDDDTDDDKFNKENLIRLITRLVFTWFMKAKGLVNEDLFKTEFLAKALNHFDPEGALDDPNAKDADKHCTFYRAILQNLFFATFNQEIKDRGFVGRQVRDAKHYNIKNYYRNAQLFTETDEAKIIAYFNGSPFVNGGLFECLDNVEQVDRESGKSRIYSWDGFSNHVHYQNGSLKSALIPDQLFFGAERMVDLSEFFENDRSSRAVKVRGIVKILNDYVFTIEENTPLDEDVALDPELLGKVFENLLGCYNPETQQMARNATGSFYTPREIVNYMVRVSLAAYLKRACPKIDAKEIDTLVEGKAELDAMPSVKAGALDILKALFKAKILDPACGSGAFPMGTLAAMVEILRTVDPDNKHWFKIVLEESLKEVESVADVGDEKERDELKTQIEYDFEKRVDFPDYARKLYVIEHCIFGSDIQPIAVQISRLRFFITLLCEQAKTDDPDKNYGITPLPNLENNFVAANSLLSIDLKDMRELLGQKKIVSLVKKLRAKRHQLFLPKTSDKKKRLQKDDEDLRGQIASAAEGLYDENVAEKLKLLEAEIVRADAELKKLTADDFKDVVRDIEETDLFGTKTVTRKTVVGKGNELKKRRDAMADEIATLKNSSRKERLLADLKRLVAWNPFAFNVAESFLDPEWMFGVKDGFDVIIANPPYIKEYENRQAFDGFREQSPYYIGKMDLWYGFACHGIDTLKQGGILCFIAQNNWTTSAGASKMREKVVADTRILQMVDFNDHMVFNSAQIQTMIMTFAKDRSGKDFVIEHRALKEGATEVDVEFMLRNQPTGNVYYRNPTLSRDDDVSHSLPLFGEAGLIKKMEGKSNFAVLESEIVQGIIGNPDDAFKIADSELGELSDSEMEFVHRFYTHTDRYVTEPGDENVIYISNKSTPSFTPEKYPGIQSRILPYKDKLLHRREVENGRLQWFFMHWPRVEKVFKAGAKIVWAARTEGRNFTYTDSEFYGSRNLFYLETDRINLKCLVGIYNSRLMLYFMENRLKHLGVLLQLDKNQIAKVPLVKPDDAVQSDVAQKVDAIIAAKQADPQADTSKLEEKIDSIVYKLYGLVDDEIKVVEKAVKK